MEKKYELTNETIEYEGRTLYRIRALRDFGKVRGGDLGGFVESEMNLSHEWDAWVSGDAEVSGDASVYGDARVSGNAEVTATRHFLCIGPIGSRNDTTTFFRTADNRISVQCGCFSGTIKEFLEKVTKTHGDNEYSVACRAAAELARACIKLEGAEG